MGDSKFILSMDFMDTANAEEDYKHPLLTWARLIFTDDKPNLNSQGISKSEFNNVLKSMINMPIKIKYAEGQIHGHDEAVEIGVITKGEVSSDQLIAVGALWNDEHPDAIKFLKDTYSAGKSVDFSWEVRYKNSEKDEAGIEWLQGVTTKAITAVNNPAYGGRTHMVAISSVVEDLKAEIKSRGLIIDED